MVSGRSDGDSAEARPKRRRLPGVNLRPGSVKQARMEAGLSLAQLGKGHVTAPAIYLIETGRTRPSLPTLEHIARRTGKPVQYFLAETVGAADDGQAGVLELEAMVDDGRYEEAIVLGQTLLERAPAAFRLGRLRWLLAQAYSAQGRLDRAMEMLEEAKAQFASVNDKAMLAACLETEARMLLGSQPQEALAVAEQALQLARSITPAPLITVATLRGIVADASAASRNWDAAVAAYEEAIRFCRVFDLRRAARTYGALAHAYREAGEVEMASRYAMRSIALREIAGGREAVGSWENRLGLALIAKGDLAGARLHFERALQIGAAEEIGKLQCDALLNLTDLAFREGDATRALEFAGKALAQAEQSEDAPSRAEAHVWLARIADSRGDQDTADREFELAIHDFEALGLADRLLHTHGIYADALERRGDLAKAYGHMKQALRASRPNGARHQHATEHAGSA